MSANSSPANCELCSQNQIDLAQMEQSLRCRLGHHVQDLRIWTEPHGLVITGCTRSYYDKQMAQHLVREIFGQDVADNRIAVNSGLAETRTGHSIELRKHQVEGGLTARHCPHRQHFPR